MLIIRELLDERTDFFHSFKNLFLRIVLLYIFVYSFVRDSFFGRKGAINSIDGGTPFR